MPLARTKRGRMRQLERWLNDKFPTGRATYVIMQDMGLRGNFGDTVRIANRIRIRLNSRVPRHFLVLILFEEWAHAMTWPLASVENKVQEHAPEWGIAYAAIRHAYDDLEGWRETREYDGS